MILNSQNNPQTAKRIPLNPIFFILATGSVTIEEVIAQYRAARAEILAAEDDYMRRRVNSPSAQTRLA